MLPVPYHPAESRPIANARLALDPRMQPAEAEVMAEARRVLAQRHEVISKEEMMARAKRTLDKAQLIAPGLRQALMAPAPAS